MTGNSAILQVTLEQPSGEDAQWSSAAICWRCALSAVIAFAGIVLGISELGTFVFTWLRKDCDISIFSWIEKILPITHNSCSCYLE